MNGPVEYKVGMLGESKPVVKYDDPLIPVPPVLPEETS